MQYRRMVAEQDPSGCVGTRHHGTQVPTATRFAYIYPRVSVLPSLTLRYVGILLKAEWIPGQGCVITDTDNTLLAATFIYSMCFDFTVLVLTAVKLSIPGKRSESSQLVKLIFGDGLIFFIIAFLSNLIATVCIRISG